jgi:hypothetical protein
MRIRAPHAGLESSLFLRHFRPRAVPRLKLRHPCRGFVRKAGFRQQPNDQLARWPSVRCLAKSNAKNAYEIDIVCRSLSHLVSGKGTDNIPDCKD